MQKYMNEPHETDGQAYVATYKGGVWICCPYCGKRQFTISPVTKITELSWQCKNNKCKKVFNINLK